MKEEFSAGGVVYKKNNQETLWLVAKHSGYHKWVLPKGMIEAGETIEQTAKREVFEETGIEADIVGSQPLHIETYEYQADYSENQITQSIGGPERRVLIYQESGGKQTWVKKTVTFFLMAYASGKIEDHSWETEEVRWVSFDDGTRLLAFEGEKKALKKANEKIINQT